MLKRMALQTEKDEPVIKKYRRRSLFDTEDSIPDLESFLLPRTREEIKYPEDYLEKVRTEIGQWKMHVNKALEEKQKCKKERKELKTKIFDENILSSEQLDFLGSISFNEYQRTVQNFLVKMAIAYEKYNVKYGEQEEAHYNTIQKKIEMDIFKNLPN